MKISRRRIKKCRNVRHKFLKSRKNTLAIEFLKVKNVPIGPSKQSVLIWQRDNPSRSVDMAVVEEFDYLCRLCATKTGILMGLPIFGAGDQMRNIDKKIAACLPVQVKSCTNGRGAISLYLQ